MTLYITNFEFCFPNDEERNFHIDRKRFVDNPPNPEADSFYMALHRHLEKINDNMGFELRSNIEVYPKLA